MLVQWTQREWPEHGGTVRRAILRHPSFVVTVLRSRGVAHDWGLQVGMVAFMDRLHRTQLSVLLAGRGYFDGTTGLRLLEPGDAVESDQLLREPEGYGGSPCEVLTVEWDAGGPFGPGRRGDASYFRVGDRDRSRLRALCRRIKAMPAQAWVDELAAQLHALGHGVERDIDATRPPAPGVARAFALMGDAISRIEVRPSLSELADRLAVTERQANRYVRELATAFDHPNDGWQEFIRDARLGVAMQLLSLPGIPIARVAKLSGYGSDIALAHALSLRGAPSPGALARQLADRWR